MTPLFKSRSLTRTFAIMFGAGFCLSLLPASPAPAAEIVALGASNTFGRGRGQTSDGVATADAFPAQLERLLKARGCRASVANAGVAGDTTGGMLARLQGALSADTRIVIVQPGGNDARRGQGDKVEANMAEIGQRLAARKIKMIVIDRLGQLARPYRLPDGQHYSVEGHVRFAEHLLPRVLAAGICRPAS